MGREGSKPLSQRAAASKGGAVAGLVAQGPDQHRGAVFVALDAAAHAVLNGGRELGVQGDVARVVQPVGPILGGAAVALHIRLGQQVKAVFGAQLAEPGGIGVMAGADGVDVVPLHEREVQKRLGGGDGKAGEGIAVVPVDPGKAQRLAVQKQAAALDAHLPQAHPLADELAVCSQQKGVERGLLGVPEHRRFQPEQGRSSRCFEALQRFARGGKQGELHRERAARALELHLDQGLAPGGEAGVHKKVPQVGGGAAEQVHIPEQAREAQLVLILEIAAGAPLEHHQHQPVFAAVHKAGQIVFRGAVGNLAVAGEGPVHVYIAAGIGPFQHQMVPLAGLFLQRKAAPVHPAGVLGGHKGRVVGEGVADVGVLGAAVAVQLPAGGHGDGGLAGQGPARRRIFGDAAGGRPEGKTPLPAEGQHAGRVLPRAGQRLRGGGAGDIIRAVRQGVFAEQAGVLPITGELHRVPPLPPAARADAFGVFLTALRAKPYGLLYRARRACGQGGGLLIFYDSLRFFMFRAARRCFWAAGLL